MFDRPIATTVLVLAILLLGGLSLHRLPPALWPEIDLPEFHVTTRLPAAAPSDVEEQVTDVLEPVMAGIEGVERLESVSGHGVSRTWVRFAWGTDLDFAFLELRKRLDEARSLLPTQASRPVVEPPPDPASRIAVIAVALEPDMEVGFPGWNGGDLEAFRWADGVLARALEAEPGIARATVVGGILPQVDVRLSPQRLRRHGLTFPQVMAQVAGMDRGRPLGELDRSGFRHSVRLEQTARGVEDLRERIVAGGAESPVIRLGDVAVVDVVERPLAPVTMLDGRRVIVVEVHKSRSAGSLEAFGRVRRVVSGLGDRHPGIHVEVVREQAGRTRALLDQLLWTLLAGGALAVTVLFVFLRQRGGAFGIALSIPVSLAMTFILLDLAGVGLTVLSLFGLLLGVGLLLDNAIVVMENVSRLRESGLGRREAARRGAAEVRAPIIASTLTTLAVFLPLWLIGGFHGALFRDLTVSLGVSLSASVFTALGVLPVFLAHFGRGGWSRGGAGVDRGSGGSWWSRGGAGVPLETRGESLNSSSRWVSGLDVRDLPDRLRARPRLLGASTLVMLVLAIAGIWRMPKAVFPAELPDSVRVQVVMDANMSMQDGIGAAYAIMTRIGEATGIRSVLAWIGDHSSMAKGNGPGSHARTGPGEEGGETGVGDAFSSTIFLSIPIASWGERQGLTRVLDALREAHPGWRFDSQESDVSDEVRPRGALLSGESIGASDGPGAVTFTLASQSRGMEHAVATRLAEHLHLSGHPVRLEPAEPRNLRIVEVSIQSERLAGYGIDAGGVGASLRAWMGGVHAASWDHEDARIPVVLRMDAAVDREGTEDAIGEGGRFGERVSSLEGDRFGERGTGVPSLGGVRLGERGTGVPIWTLLDTVVIAEPSERVKVALMPAARYATDLTFRDWWRDGKRIERLVDEFSRQTGQVVSIDGPAWEAGMLLERVGGLLLLSSLLMYLVLCVQYESLIDPLLILLSVPFALSGALVALWAGGVGLNLFSGMGMLILVGIAVNDAILKVDVMRRLVAGGMAVGAAVHEAGRLRARPVIMTTLTTVLSLGPMVLDLGAGGAMKRSLALAVIGGMASSTVLTLALLPQLYGMVHGRWGVKRLSGTGRPGIGVMLILVGLLSGCGPDGIGGDSGNAGGSVLIGAGAPEGDGSGDAASDGGGEAAPILPDVTFVMADTGSLPQLVLGVGLVEQARAFPVVGVQGGVIRSHLLVDGVEVRAGDTLMALDARHLELAERRARAQYWLRLQEYRIESGVAGQAPLSANGTDGAVLFQECVPPEQPVLAVSRGLAEACLQWEMAMLEVERSTILAPFDGIVSTDRTVRPGEWAAPGQTLGLLLDPSRAQVRLQVLDAEAPKVREGQPVRLFTPSGEIVDGIVERVSPKTDPKTRTAGVWVGMVNAEGRLMPGMRLDGEILTGWHQGKVRVPASAVLERNGKTMVFVLKDGQVEWVYVRRVAGERDHVLLDGEEIQIGDTVAVDRHFSIRHQQRVNPILLP